MYKNSVSFPFDSKSKKDDNIKNSLWPDRSTGTKTLRFEHNNTFVTFSDRYYWDSSSY